MTLSLTPYQPEDKAGVLAVFRSNAPDYFAPDEDEDLIATLDGPDGPHWVVREDGEIVGYGGYEVGEMYNRVVLTWGMVRRDRHRAGLGRALLAHRAREAMRETAGGTSWLVVDTPPAVAGFFERCGFERLETWAQGYRAGFDMVVLRMEFGSPAMAALVA
jgi:GNAT superfamily N-acetyltransferase